MYSIRKNVLLCFKLAIAACLIYFIVVKTNWHIAVETIIKTNLSLLFSAFCIMLLCVPCSVYKWFRILQIHEQKIGIKKLAVWYYIAMFFNNFFPTGIGGDGYRIWKTIDVGTPRGISLLAVLVERISGIIVLLGLGFVSAWIGWLSGGHGFVKVAAISGVSVIVFIAILLFVFLRSNYLRIFSIDNYLSVKMKMEFIHIQDYLKQPLASVSALVLLSLLFHILSITWKFILIRSLGGTIEIWEFALVMSLIALVTVIPLSVNGLGTVDASFIWLVGQFGVPFETGVGYMILLRILLLPVSLTGAVLYLRAHRT